MIDESNQMLIIETLRSIAELLIWGDQHETRFFECVLCGQGGKEPMAGPVFSTPAPAARKEPMAPHPPPLRGSRPPVHPFL